MEFIVNKADAQETFPQEEKVQIVFLVTEMRAIGSLMHHYEEKFFRLFMQLQKNAEIGSVGASVGIRISATISQVSYLIEYIDLTKLTIIASNYPAPIAAQRLGELSTLRGQLQRVISAPVGAHL